MNLRFQLPALLLLAGAAAAQGDDCSAPLTANLGSNAFDLFNYTDSGYYDGSCVGRDGFEDIWFVFTAPTTDVHQFETCGSDFDTTLRIYDSAACNSLCLAGNDDACAMSNGVNWASKVATQLTAGQSYLIQIETWDAGVVGLSDLQISVVAGVTNDTCSTATAIRGAGPWTYDTTGATVSGFTGNSACASGSFDVGPDVFFEWTATTAGDYEFTTEFSGYDTKLNVHTGAGCTATCAGYNDDFYGLQSRVLVSGLNAGDTLLVQCGGWNGSAGPGQLEVRTAVDVCTTYTDDSLEDNDTTATALALTAGSYPGLVSFDPTAGVGDSDFYSVTLQPGEYLDLAIVNINPNTEDIDFTEYDGAGNFVQDWDTNLVTIANPGASASTHIIEVRPDFAFGARCAQYDMDLTIQLDPCINLQADVFESNDTTATATSIVSGVYTGLNVTDSVDADLFTFVVANGATFSAEALHNSAGCANADIDMFLYDPNLSPVVEDPGTDPFGQGELAAAYTCADAETLSWTNTTGADVTCVLRVSVWPVGAVPGCSFYDLTLTGADADGPDLFCDPANVNSTGNSVTLEASDFSGSGDFHIEATGGPNNQFGMVIVSSTALDPGIPVSQGNLCLGAPIGRYASNAGPGLSSIGRFDAAGVLQNLFGTSTTGTGFDVPAVLPSPPGGIISSGSTWHFQLWYRDGTASNFSNGISVAF